jgi:hypothetical protein
MPTACGGRIVPIGPKGVEVDEQRESDLSLRMDAAASEIARLRAIVERAIVLRGEIRGLVRTGPPEAA